MRHGVESPEWSAGFRYIDDTGGRKRHHFVQSLCYIGAFPRRNFAGPATGRPCRPGAPVHHHTMSYRGAQLVTAATRQPQIVFTVSITPTKLSVGWTWAIGDLLPEEIPFMVVGDVGDPPLLLRIFGRSFTRHRE